MVNNSKNCVDICIEFCYRGSSAPAGNMTVVLEHTQALPQNVIEGAVLLFDHSFERSLPISSHRQLLVPISGSVFNTRPVFFLDLYLTASLSFNQAYIKADLAFSRICRIRGGMKHEASDELIQVNDLPDTWLPTWKLDIDQDESIARQLNLTNHGQDMIFNVLRFEFERTSKGMERAIDVCCTRLLHRPSHVNFHSHADMEHDNFREKAQKLTSKSMEQVRKSRRQNAFGLDDLPNEIILDIIDKVPANERMKTVSAVLQLNKRFNTLLQHPSVFTNFEVNLDCFGTSDKWLPNRFLFSKLRMCRNIRISWLPRLNRAFEILIESLPHNQISSFICDFTPALTDGCFAKIVTNQPHLSALGLSGKSFYSSNLTVEGDDARFNGEKGNF